MKEIIIYTSDKCPYCSTAEKILKEVLDEYNGLFNYKQVNISENKEHNINSLPTIYVGEQKIEGLPEKEQLHTALFSS
ncbi:MAG: glutaredoxin family protein [Candidatus Heimdallarchaeaceae archaeon]